MNAMSEEVPPTLTRPKQPEILLQREVALAGAAERANGEAHHIRPVFTIARVRLALSASRDSEAGTRP